MRFLANRFGEPPHYTSETMVRNPDKQLVERAQGGDQEAFASLFRRYWGRARAAAYGVLGRMEVAEEVAALAMHLAFSNLAALRDPAAIGRWIHVIVIRNAKRELQRDPVTEPLGDFVAAAKFDPVQNHELHVVRECVDALPSELREVIALFYMEDLSIPEVARFLNKPEGTIKRKLHDARKALRKLLESGSVGRGREDSARLLTQIQASLDGGPDDPLVLLKEAWKLRIDPDRILKMIAENFRSLDGANADGLQKIYATLYPRLATWSERASETPGPVADMGRRLLAVSRDFIDWKPDASQAWSHSLLSGSPKKLLPPGFNDGQPGKYRHKKRGMVFVDEGGSICPQWEAVSESNSMGSFHSLLGKDMCLSDVLDLWWARHELPLLEFERETKRLLQGLLGERHVEVVADPVPQGYKHAFQVRVDGQLVATGGAFDIPSGLAAMHLRLYLEPLTAVQTGSSYDFPSLASLSDEIEDVWPTHPGKS